MSCDMISENLYNLADKYEYSFLSLKIVINPNKFFEVGSVGVYPAFLRGVGSSRGASGVEGYGQPLNPL